MGYLRVRRSIKLGPGVKFILNKRSVGLTVGGRGAHNSVNTRGHRTTTVGLPGTGVSYINRSTGRHHSSGVSGRSAQSTAPLVPDAPSAAAHPGLFAHHYERAFYSGIQQLANGNLDTAVAAFREADQADRKHHVVSPALFVGFLTAELGDAATAIPYLERVTTSERRLPDELMNKYAGRLQGDLRVDGQISMPIEIGSAAAAFVLAQCYGDTGRVEDAIGLMQQLYDNWRLPAMLLALCNMYLRAEEWDEIVHAAAGVSNQDDITLIVRLQQAEALERQGLPDAALEAYRDALKSKQRNPELLKCARYGRAALYLRMGKRGMAKRDLARLCADDPDYKDVFALLRTLG